MASVDRTDPVPAPVKCVKQWVELDTWNTEHRIDTVREQSFNYRLSTI
jgi:hypothetical protein